MKRLYIPFILELVLIIATIIWEKQSFGLFFAYYTGLLIYFYFVYKQFSFRKLRSNFSNLKTFWIPVILTVAGMLLASKFETFIRMTFYSECMDSIVSIPIQNELIPILFDALVCIIMKPVAEELFYRKAIIRFDSKKKVVLLTIASLILCAVTRAHGLIGIATFVVMALPVTIAYIVTRNIYVSIMAHVIFEFISNVYGYAYVVGRLYFR